MKHLLTIAVACICFLPLQAQTLKDKVKLKTQGQEKFENYKCGYVHEESVKEKMNPMKALQKSMGSAVSSASKSDLGTASISVFYQAHLHPQNIMRYPTKTPGWETCGDAVFLGFTNKSGIGLCSTDGEVTVENQTIPYAGIGTYFHGFSPEKRGNKKVLITSSNGDNIELEIEPAQSLEILSIDGLPKGEVAELDGSKDIVVELANGDADPKSQLHVQLVCKLMGTPIIYDLLVTQAKNKIVIPKESFYNFEGSPSPFAKTNTLIVNRVTETLVEKTDAGALRTISAYMDWAPVKVSGDIANGNVLTMGFDTTKNTQMNLNVKNEGNYTLNLKKGNPYTSAPLTQMKSVAIASFVVRGNLSSKQVSATEDWTVETTKWFPELSDQNWQMLSNKMYDQFVTHLSNMGIQVINSNDVVNSEAYNHIKSIQDGATKNFVEVGAYGTKRILTTSGDDIMEDLSISFPSDFISERLISELEVDGVLAVTFDLDFNFETEGLDPKVSVQAFAPNVSYKTAANYFKVSAYADSRSLKESKEIPGPVHDILYEMIKGDAFFRQLEEAMTSLMTLENKNPAYINIWKAKSN